MKPAMLLLIASISFFGVNAQKLFEVNGLSMNVKIKDDKSKNRYKKSTAVIICGYYSDVDQNFYYCNGQKCEKVTDKTKLKDGDGCCEDITLSIGSFNASGSIVSFENNIIELSDDGKTFKIKITEAESKKLDVAFKRERIGTGDRVNVKVVL
jgi:hypothetical protein